MPLFLRDDDSGLDQLPRFQTRSVQRHVALLLVTLGVVLVPNLVAFAASLLD